MNLEKKKEYSKMYDNIYDENSCVTELTMRDFIYKDKKLYLRHKVFEGLPSLIVFYAPWCKSCQHLSDSIIEIAYLKQNTFRIGSVNAENIENGNDILCSHAKIKHYPTLKIVQSDGSLEDYKGTIHMDNILFYINTMIDE